jgi:NAD(P)-dependent dehydrogenase (short-subunit alcohol dehydrogenase family)
MSGDIRAMADATRTAVVTGAGSGIGRAVALALLDAGWQVALAGRRAETLRETAGGSDRAAVIRADVTDVDAVRNLFSSVRNDFGRIDLLFNNAGSFGVPSPIEDVQLDDWNTVVATNLTGSFLCAQEAFRAMKEQQPQGGRIVNNGSISAHVPRPYAVAYTATKHAITGLTKALSLEGRQYDIACSQIDIGNAGTDMTEAMKRGVPQADGSVAPEPIMDVQHVADAVLYMADLPLDANVQFMTVMATKMPFIGRG